MPIAKTMKKNSIKTAFLRLLLLLVIAAALMFIGGREGLRLLRGPANLADVPMEEWNGKYVYFDYTTDYGMYGYMQETKGSTVLRYQFLIVAPNDVQLMGVEVDPKFDKELDDIYAEAERGFEQGLYDDANPPPPIRFKGVVEELDGTELRYFNSGLDDAGVSRATGIPYVLRHGKAGGMAIWLAWVLLGVSALLVLWGVVSLVRAFAGSYQKSIQKYYDENGAMGEVGAEKLNASFENAAKFGKSRFGTEAIVYQQGIKTKVLPVKDLVWAYMKTTRTNGVESSHELMLGTQNGKIQSVNMRRRAVGEALAHIEANYPNVAMGFTNELSGLFKQNPAGMRNIAESQRAPRQPEASAPTPASVPAPAPPEAAPPEA